MRWVLTAAGTYNFFWAAWTILFPAAWFHFAGLPQPLYPEIWQGTGMLVGIYGIGYWIAATDPYRHWALVFVGLLGKVLAPAGFLYAVQIGRMPLGAIWTPVLNDVIWWLPFALILAGAYQEHLGRLRCLAPQVLKFALRTKTESGIPLDQLSRMQPVLLVFLRHTGCTFCREALSDLAKQRRGIEAAGASLVLVHMGCDPSGAASLLAKYGLQDVLRIHDANCCLYRAFGLGKGTLGKLFGPKVWVRGIQALLQGHGVGRLAGDGFQMPGIFLLYHGEVIRSYRHQSAADRPDYIRFVTEENVSQMLS